MTSTLTFLTEQEEHSFQYRSKAAAAVVARIESQRTGVKHTHHLTLTWRNLERRLCWAVIPVRTAVGNLRTTSAMWAA